MIFIKDIVKVLKGNFRGIAILCLLVTLVVSILNIFFIEPQYEAFAEVRVGKETEIIKINYISNDPEEAYNKVKTTLQGLMNNSNEIFGGNKVEVIKDVKFPVKPIVPKKLVNIILSFCISLVSITLLVVLFGKRKRRCIEPREKLRVVK